MSIDLLLGGAVAILFLAGAGILLVLRRRRREKLELRLLAGRERLLGDELEACLAALEELDDGRVATARASAEEALNGLHTRLVERQAHLLNYEDLVHLQECKIEALQAIRLAPPLAQEPSEGTERAGRERAPGTRRATDPRPRDRGTRPPARIDDPEPPEPAPRPRPPSPRPEPSPPPKGRAQLEEELRQRINRLRRDEDDETPSGGGKPTRRR
ncbi:MAG: hypothetical protein WDA75_05605 [Candidatus Latescibacterota bacterium]